MASFRYLFVFLLIASIFYLSQCRPGVVDPPSSTPTSSNPIDNSSTSDKKNILSQSEVSLSSNGDVYIYRKTASSLYEYDNSTLELVTNTTDYVFYDSTTDDEDLTTSFDAVDVSSSNETKPTLTSSLTQSTSSATAKALPATASVSTSSPVSTSVPSTKSN